MNKMGELIECPSTADTSLVFFPVVAISTVVASDLLPISDLVSAQGRFQNSHYGLPLCRS